jgi:hypothetical protein
VIALNEPQMWSLIGLLGAAILASPTIIVLYIRSEISGLRREMGGQIGGLRREMELRFEAMDRRFDHLDRDVAAIAKVVFPER